MKREHWLYYTIALGILVAGLAWAGVLTSTMLVGLLVLACPLMMLFMMRGMHGNGDGHDGRHHHDEPHDSVHAEHPLGQAHSPRVRRADK